MEKEFLIILKYLTVSYLLADCLSLSKSPNLIKRGSPLVQGMPLLKNNPLDCFVNSPYAERRWKRDFAVCGQRQGTLSPCSLQAFKEGKILASKNQPKLLILRFYSFSTDCFFISVKDSICLGWENSLNLLTLTVQGFII